VTHVDDPHLQLGREALPPSVEVTRVALAAGAPIIGQDADAAARLGAGLRLAGVVLGRRILTHVRAAVFLLFDGRLGLRVCVGLDLDAGII
jgi:hypothetical protein